MIDRYNSIAGKECFGLCLDMGHLNLLNLDMSWYIPILGKRITALHVHDNDGMVDRQHREVYGKRGISKVKRFLMRIISCS